ncbi:hypothetical protein [Algoriphagus boritolerans]|uniref:hypothetical protein n=1 Tax=Algoriphagus boritolerans TaxID=308111 RepID=UPI000AAD8584
MKVLKYVFVLALFILSNCEEKEIPSGQALNQSVKYQILNRSLHVSGGCAYGQTGLGEVGERKIQLATVYRRLDIDKICLAQNPSSQADFGFVGNTVEYEITSDGFLDFFRCFRQSLNLLRAF